MTYAACFQIVFLALAALCAGCKKKERILLQIGGVSYTIKDFKKEAGLYTKGLPAISSSQGDLIKEQVLNRMILKGLIAAESAGKPPLKNDFLNNSAKQAGSRARLLQMLPSGEEPLTESRIKNFYRKNKNSFYAPERCVIERIVVSKESMALSIRQRLKRGEDFATLARLYSQASEKGRPLTWIVGGGLKILDRTCAGAPGSVSPPLKSPYGFHIVKVKEKTRKRQKTFKEAEPSIVKRLQTKDRQKAFERWLSQALKQHPIFLNEELWDRAQIRHKLERP